MCADVLMCVGVFSTLVQSASMMCVIYVRVHTCKTNPLGQQLIQGAHVQSQGRKLMFTDCKCIQYVSGRKKREARGERGRERRGGGRQRAGGEEIQMTGNEAEIETEQVGKKTTI